MNLAIEFDNISKIFPGKRFQKVEALKNISFSVAVGEIFGFLGPNGSGKSTTIKILLDLIRATHGHARIQGVDSRNVDSRRAVGYLPENPSFYDTLPGDDYLVFVGKCFDLKKNELMDRKETILKRLDLWDARRRPIRSYSKGMVQRLALAQALLHDPQILVLDEPMSGLDPIGRALVKDILLEQKNFGKSVFFSTHITADVEQVCDRVGILVSGQLQSIETLSSVFSEGIEGYHILTERDSVRSEHFATKECITEVLQNLARHDENIVLIEPKRKNLEAFFLDIVKTSPH